MEIIRKRCLFGTLIRFSVVLRGNSNMIIVLVIGTIWMSIVSLQMKTAPSSGRKVICS